MSALCVGKSEVFDSTDEYLHRRARDICAACPVMAACHARVRTLVETAHPGYGPTGTWAGELFTEDRIERMQTVEERAIA